MGVKAKWKGGTQSSKGDDFRYLNGVPARDLTDDDYKALDADAKRSVRESGLYEMQSNDDASPRSKTSASKADDTPAEGSK